MFWYLWAHREVTNKTNCLSACDWGCPIYQDIPMNVQE